MFPITAPPDEVRALEYFCLKTAPNLGMHFDADFWNRVLIPASVAEPALRHAMVAVGIFAEQRELMDIKNYHSSYLEVAAENAVPMPLFPLERTPDGSDVLALSNYNKSIGLLTKLVSASGETADLILLACILFICVELLRGDEAAAVRHFTGGMTILLDNLSHAQNSPGSAIMIDRVKASIMPAFNRLEMLYALFGNNASWPYAVSLPFSVPASFSSVGQARDSMVHLMNLSLRFIRTVQFLEYEPSAIPETAYEAQAALLTQLDLWQSHFSAYRRGLASKMTPDDAYASNVVEIQQIVAYTWLSTCMTPFQCAHDVHIPAYTRAIVLAEQLSSIASKRVKSKGKAVTFLLDVEIVGPLYWILVKCREPTVRRRANTVMRGLSRREGIWDSRILAAIAERVVAVEEADLMDGGLPSEETRVHSLPFANETNLEPLGYLTTFHTKPFGVYGDWSIWQEHVKLDVNPAAPSNTSGRISQDFASDRYFTTVGAGT